jgi:Tol biopolymer transport system component
MHLNLAFLAVLTGPLLAQAQQPKPPVINGGLPSVSPSGDAIAFLSNRDGDYDVYVTTPDGSELMRITRSPASESAPLWTGSRLVFAIWADNKSTVYAASAGAPQPTAIGTSSGRQPAISPDGKRLLFSKGQFPAMQLIESALDGSNERELTKTPSAQFNAVYSPDQKRIAFARTDSTRQLQIWIMNADGSGERQLTHFKTEEGSPQWPAWSPDGASIAIQSGRYNRQTPSENTAHIWLIDVKSGAAKRLNPHDNPYLDETPSWFPDGKRIAFQSDRTGRMEVWVMNADGTGSVQVTR